MTNAVGASISGVVGVDGAGIYVTGGAATITNNGQVNGSRYAILVAAGGSVTNSSSGTIKARVWRLPEQRRHALQQRRDFLHRGWQRRG